MTQNIEVFQAANSYFDAVLWLQMPFGKNVFWAYNLAHLAYLEEYIAAFLRESPNRTHFTMVEILPKVVQRLLIDNRC